MAHDETEFDKLLKEAREWEARDRTRQKFVGMREDDGVDSFPAATRAPTVTIQELEKQTTADFKAKQASPRMETPRAEAANPALALKSAFKNALKQAQVQAQAQTKARARPATERPKSKGGGWVIWLLVALYILYRSFVHR